MRKNRGIPTPTMHRLLEHFLQFLVLQPMNAQVDISRDPTFFPWVSPVLVKRYSVDAGVPASIKQEAPGIGVVVFPALRERLLMTGQFQSLCVGIFPSDTPAVVCVFGLWDVTESRPEARRVLLPVPLSLHYCQARVSHAFLAFLRRGADRFPALPKYR